MVYLMLLLTAFASVFTWKYQENKYESQIKDMELSWQQQIDKGNQEAQQNLDAANLLGNQLSDTLIKLQQAERSKTDAIIRKVNVYAKSNPVKCDLSNPIWLQLYNDAARADQSGSTSTAK